MPIPALLPDGGKSATPREVLVATLKDVNETEVPDDLRVIAFTKVFDMRSGQGGPSTRDNKQPARTTGNGSGGLIAGDLLDAVAARAGIDRETVAEVFDERNGGLELIIGPRKLPPSVSAGTKEIALLVAGGRQAAGIEEWTSLDDVRDVCQEFKKLDSGNFAKTIKSMTDEFNVRKESERKTVVRVSRPGWDAFSKLLVRLSGAAA